MSFRKFCLKLVTMAPSLASSDPQSTFKYL